ncbi:MAG: uroporphyrinogen-III C-methyltransferase [Spirulina sp. SIO3F2]|nr:uroporphyrinogen-III C-methyltransferase [Spirulina sp. SIO3F2]
MNQLGHVYFIGAGVGARTITLQGFEALKQADVAIYDALVDATLLAHVPDDCLQIPVGKRGGQKSTPQAEINRLLIAYAQQGQTVVRLKSGDGMIFGRIREEIEALRMVPCTWTIVPGVSSALAAPALAGIPLTDKVLSQGFGVFTGHNLDALDWDAIARLETLVFLMASRNLPEILQRLQANGKAAETAIAIIRQAGCADQQLWSGTLTDILDATAGIRLSPCIVVIGEVVTLQQTLSGPLAGQTILVTRAASQASAFTQMLRAQGATVIDLPALEITPPSSWAALDEAIAQLEQFDWLILTSANGVNYFFERLHAAGKDSRALGGVKIAVVGKKTAKVLGNYHLSPDFIPPNYVADSLVEAFPESLTGKKILFPRVETGGRELLMQELTAQGAQLTEVPAYQSGCPEAIAPAAAEALDQGQADIITFASSKTVKNVQHLLTQVSGLDSQLPNVCLASIGPQTSVTCQDCFGRVDLEAKEYTLEGLTAAMITWVSQQR